MTTAVCETQNETKPAVETQAGQQLQNVVIPEYRILHKEEGYEIRVELPGVSEEGLEISLEDRWLILKASPELMTEEGFELIHSEFGQSRYEVGFKVSASIDGSEIKAQLNDGILTLTLPKAKEHLRRSIQVTTG